MTRIAVNGATAMFPGLHVELAIARIVAREALEPFLGVIGAEDIQLCPQSAGLIDEACCDRLRATHPRTRFRLHANARVEPGLRVIDASTPWPTARGYFERIADRSRRLGATYYSVHAGYRDSASLQEMLDNLCRIQDTLGPECVVAVEGLYPSKRRPQLMATWKEYEAVLASGSRLALDLSHLHIVATAFGREDALTATLISSPQTMELHVSGNDGTADRHDAITQSPWWWPLLASTRSSAVVFCESNLLRNTQPQPIGGLNVRP